MAVMTSGIEGDPEVERTSVHPVQVQALRIIDDVLSAAFQYRLVKSPNPHFIP
ncbi:hypothetical protein AB0N71_01655 [Pseudarthrobacter enclensis]|uniref:hypothetical protein n=1 Tax=Pseudarthrobacter enclensis TaxID=993070 RepID=UPI00343FD2BD